MNSECIPVVLPMLLEPVELIVEPLPLVSAVPEVVRILIVELLDIPQVALHEVEVEADLPLDLSSVEEEDELGLNSSIEEELDLWRGVAVNFDVGEAGVLGCESLVVLLDLLADGVPLGPEVDAGEDGPPLVKILHNVLRILGHNEVLAGLSDDGPLG
eukprot:CAMPEP_0168619856 /NCGR_PEP_ID=MMETSP0449_2-20121227/6825_1 /TAXON_ID=1082188 /ORGANISM="Strombidium rassoulzadegani, Strain ras09" /LENGTH=157 /DNA_ID=CAMNT_0008660819 /DNA_START=139 /DNA_END=612 /DNA_ORIENTATION=-